MSLIEWHLISNTIKKTMKTLGRISLFCKGCGALYLSAAPCYLIWITSWGCVTVIDPTSRPKTLINITISHSGLALIKCQKERFFCLFYIRQIFCFTYCEITHTFLYTWLFFCIRASSCGCTFTVELCQMFSLATI